MKKIVRVAVVFAVVVVITAFVIASGRGNGPPQPVPAVPTPVPTLGSVMYREMDVETASAADVARAMGAPTRTSYYKTVATLIYPSAMSGRNISVEINQDGSLKRIIEPLAETQRFSVVASGIGKEGVVLYGKHEDLGFRLYVYADKGVALLANPETNVVREKWYFPKTDSLTFQAALGEGFITTHTEIKQ